MMRIKLMKIEDSTKFSEEELLTMWSSSCIRQGEMENGKV